MANKNLFSWELYQKAPIVGIVRGVSLDVIGDIANVYVNAGMHTLEITMNTSGAVHGISQLRSEFPDLNVGAGTVCTMKDLKMALAAGAQFIVTPIMVPKVIGHCVKNNIPVFPGAYTPTEIYQAWSLGASAVKIFPATQLGVQFIKDVSAPLNTIKLLPTGGISVDNIKSFFKVGVFGVGMGSSLFDENLIQARNFEGLENHFKEIKTQITTFI